MFFLFPSSPLPPLSEQPLCHVLSYCKSLLNVLPASNIALSPADPQSGTPSRPDINHTILFLCSNPPRSFQLTRNKTQSSLCGLPGPHALPCSLRLLPTLCLHSPSLPTSLGSPQHQALGALTSFCFLSLPGLPFLYPHDFLISFKVLLSKMILGHLI